jgi:exopolysaccharide production protein ExoZ
MKPKLYALELGRFVAALVVMFCHTEYFLDTHMVNPAVPMFGGFTFPGPFGVQYFFVLSGFVMASAHYRDFGNIAAIPRFWWRRVCRIYPAYWLALTIPVYYVYSAGALTAGHLLTVALLSPWHTNEFILAAWSLRYELVFYIMFGLTMLPYVGKPLLAFWVFFIFWRWSLLNFLHFHPPFLFAVNHVVAIYGERFAAVFEIFFFAGLAIGYAYVKRRINPWLCAGMLLGGGVLVGSQLRHEDWGLGYGDPTISVRMALGVAGVILGLAGLERAGWLRLGPWAGRLGMLSYPLYVVHVPLLNVADHVLHKRLLTAPELYTGFIVLSLACLIAAALVTMLFDQPLQRQLRRLEGKRRGALPPRPPLGLRPRPH